MTDELPRRDENHPGWVWMDCGCCAGIKWGGDYPQECEQCKGSGVRCVHLASKRIAEWPGGPFLGTSYDKQVAYLAEVTS